MSDYKSVLVHVSDSEQSSAVLRFAAQLASEHGASLRAVHAVEPPNLGAFLSPEGAMIAGQLRQDAERVRASSARERVLEAARACGIDIDFHGAGADPLVAMSAACRASDLVVLAQPSGDDADGLSRRFEPQLLVGAGCPLIFLPGAGSVTGCGTRVLVAWTPTRESTRALRDAIPILQRASAVEVLRLGSAAGAEPLDAVATYLLAHGVQATCNIMEMRQRSFPERLLSPAVGDASVAELLLSHAADTGADLIVMGGYGHTRTYELVLGGVTRTMLASMTVPVLMSH